MKCKKICDGVWEFPSWKPEPVGDGSKHADKWPWNDRLHMVIPNSEVRSTYNFSFWPNYYGYGNAEPAWHLDGGLNSNFTHVLLIILCDEGGLGTEFRPPSGETFHGKPWTPYLMRSNTPHRSPGKGWKVHRVMYRHFLKLDEATLVEP